MVVVRPRQHHVNTTMKLCMSSSCVVHNRLVNQHGHVLQEAPPHVLHPALIPIAAIATKPARNRSPTVVEYWWSITPAASRENNGAPT